MSNRSALLLFVPLLGPAAVSQCTVPIPNDAIIMTVDDSSTSFVQQSVYLCSGTYVSASSVDPVIFLESGAHMNFSGISKNIYAKAGSIVDGSGIDDTIYYEVGAQLLIGGINQTFIECAPLIFDFGSIGVSPCASTSVRDVRVDPRFELYPALATGHVEIIGPDGNASRKIQVIDRFGRTVLTRSMVGTRTTLDVASLAAGSYSVIVTGDDYRWTGRFINE